MRGILGSGGSLGGGIVGDVMGAITVKEPLWRYAVGRSSGGGVVVDYLLVVYRLEGEGKYCGIIEGVARERGGLAVDREWLVCLRLV